MKKQAQILLAVISAALFSAVLTASTVFLAPLPLMVLRLKKDRKSMIFAALLGGAMLISLAPLPVILTYLVAIGLAFVLSECEAAGVGYATSVFVTVVVLSGLVFLIGSFAVHTWGFDPVLFFREQIAQSLTQIKLPADLNLDKDSLLKQVPSALVMLIIFAVWINSVFAPRLAKVLGGREQVTKHFFISSELLQWKVPDGFVWIALAVAAGHFLEVQPSWLKWACTNAFNVFVMLYFFQGLAVIVSFFDTKKISSPWRLICYLLIFTQLFLAVALLGFIDLWLEFRKKKKTDKSAVA